MLSAICPKLCPALGIVGTLRTFDKKVAFFHQRSITERVYQSAKEVGTRALGALAGEGLKKAAGALFPDEKKIIVFQTPEGMRFDHDSARPLLPRLREVAELGGRDLHNLHCTYYKSGDQVPTSIAGEEGWQNLMHYIKKHPGESLPLIYIKDPENAFIAFARTGKQLLLPVEDGLLGKFLNLVVGTGSSGKELENSLNDLDAASLNIVHEDGAIWQAEYDYHRYDPTIDAWVEIGLPSSFGKVLKLSKDSVIPAVTAQFQKRSLTASDSDSGDHKLLNKACYLSFYTTRHEQAVISTIAMRTIDFELPDGKPTMGPKLSRALQKYTMASAQEFFAEEVKKRGLQIAAPDRTAKPW
eukprot:TRINITY_DN89617_c0_g1_i1.p1 TRINITY_DN89617_c0_g1~~TRINITY_DN89617_c0_g1_i1.p1  ORF type:complete len:356 (-),score=73.65 TRINITY_DN89617_c0_g1_i1:105-1172(-)